MSHSQLRVPPIELPSVDRVDFIRTFATGRRRHADSGHPGLSTVHQIHADVASGVKP